MSALLKTRSDTLLEKTSELLAHKMSTARTVYDMMVRDLHILARDRVEFPAGRMLVKDRDLRPQLYLVEAGWVFRSRGLASGRRQIVNYALPGDFLCVDSVMFRSSGFDLVSRTPVSLLRVEALPVADLFQHYPGLAAGMAWSAAQEESVLAERAVSLGRRDSLEKLAHALCEMEARLARVGLMRGRSIACPLNQEDFADMLGISVIHVNRTFRRLAEEGAAEYRKGQIEMLDPAKLAELAAFDPAYLRFAPVAAPGREGVSLSA